MTGSANPATQAAPRHSRWGDLGVRAASGFVLTVIALGTARIGGEWFMLAWLAAAVAVFWEWQRLLGRERLPGRLAIGVAALVAITWLARDRLSDAPGLTHIDLGPLSLGLILASIAQATLAGPGRRLWATMGMLYAGALLVAVLVLRFSFPYGIRSIVWLFAIVWSTDVAAYFGGRLIGGPKLWSRVSPSKTWSGSLVGTFVGAAIGTLVVIRDLPEPFAVLPIYMLGVVTSIVSQAGDAAESGMKRHFGIKDSSRLIPGHGGVMDRLDGFIFAAVFAAVFGYLRNLASIALGLFYWT